MAELQLERLPVRLEKSQKLPATQECVSLREALAELGIEPFSKKSVERYKRNMARRVTPFSGKILMLLALANNIILATSIVLVGLIAIATLGFCFLLTLPPIWMGWSFLGTLLSALANFYVFVFFLNDKQITVGRWHSVASWSYQQSIPAFVRQTILLVEQKYPGVRFFIEELRLANHMLDPFLIALDAKAQDHEKYYLERWDEPEFDQKPR